GILQLTPSSSARRLTSTVLQTTTEPERSLLTSIHARALRVAWMKMCTPGMGINLYGASPL
ncbi:MAG: hypothetical protein ACE5HX_12350, partial [bacterium]